MSLSAFTIVAAIVAILILFYLLPAIRLYNIFWLQNFDYGIFYHSTYLLSRGEPAFMRVRGMHVWADNQDYLQYLFAPFHFLPYTHYALLAAHSLIIFAVGLLVWWGLRRHRAVALMAALGVWLSPILINMNFDVLHTEACATALLLAAALAAVSGKNLRFVLLLALAVLSKEDVAITAAGFCLIAAVQPKLFPVKRGVLAACFFCCGALLGVNLFLVKPHFVRESCSWLGDGEVVPSLQKGVLVHWFNPLVSGFDVSKLLNLFLQKEVALYLLLILWPLIFVLPTVPVLALLPLPATLINILSQSPYLMQGKFHYDHSSYAMIAIGLVVAFSRSKHALRSSALFFVLSIAIMAGLPQLFRTRPIELLRPEARDLVRDAHVIFLEHLEKSLPADTTMSSDYTSLNYLLAGHADVFMFPNPITGRYFGVYGLCETQKHISDPELVILRDHAEEPELARLNEKLTSYQRVQILLPDGREQFKIFINSKSPRAELLRHIILNAAKEGVFRAESGPQAT